MRTDRQYLLGFIGCGHMGMAIAKGAVAKEYIERRQICTYDQNPEVRKACMSEGFKVMDSAAEAAEQAHILLLAVKPQELDKVIEEIKDADIHTILSIVAGVSIGNLQSKLGNVPVIRAMPNTPLQISEGATALCKSSNCKADEYDFVFQMFSSMGVTRTVPEDKMNEIIAVNGSTPAYVYYFIDSMVKDAAARGIDEYDARALIVQTFLGSAKLLLNNPGKSLDAFISEVCTKGGTTIEAIDVMRREKLEDIIKAASDACIKRAAELGK